jgi:nucleotide-binding universal stress UspA family protein
MFTKILVPIDGSGHAKRAMETAVLVAIQFSGTITLIHVYSLNVFLPLYLYGEQGVDRELTYRELSKIGKGIHAAGENLLADHAKTIADRGIFVETRLIEGHVMQEIVKAATEGQFDLIVMGAKGESEIKETLLGSVSEKVARNAPCTILIVK